MAFSEQVVERILEKYRHDPHYLVQILRETQDALDWISPQTQAFIAANWTFRDGRVEAVLQFYAHLYDQPRGKYRILFSDNITDRMLGSPALIEHMLQAAEDRSAARSSPTAWSAST